MCVVSEVKYDTWESSSGENWTRIPRRANSASDHSDTARTRTSNGIEEKAPVVIRANRGHPLVVANGAGVEVPDGRMNKHCLKRCLQE